MSQEQTVVDPQNVVVPIAKRAKSARRLWRWVLLCEALVSIGAALVWRNRPPSVESEVETLGGFANLKNLQPPQHGYLAGKKNADLRQLTNPSKNSTLGHSIISETLYETLARSLGDSLFIQCHRLVRGS